MYSSRVLLLLNKISLEMRRQQQLRFHLHDSEQIPLMLKAAQDCCNPRIRWLLFLLEEQTKASEGDLFTMNRVQQSKAS